MVFGSVVRGLLFLTIAASALSCGPSQRRLFSEKKSPHEKYGDGIKEAGLQQTQLGSLWFFAAGKSLSQPSAVTIPYKETGYFAAEQPAAAGYLFSVRRGATLQVSITVTPAVAAPLFVELWQPASTPDKFRMLQAADSTLTIRHEVENDGQLLIRVQPELLRSLEYTLTITSAPSLAFPVSQEGNPRLISFWSDARDGGVRSHEGVDIGARFRTPAIASADGFVHRVTDNRLGGKVVFMRPAGKNYTLYYAHLDTQIVRSGDEVKLGQVIGLVGNTGNARTTAPHLHFGIYAIGGAVDPLPFIDPRVPEPRPVTASLNQLNEWVRTSASIKMHTMPSVKSDTVSSLPTGTALKISAATADWYKALLADGREGFVNGKSVTSRLITTKKIDTPTRLLDVPASTAAAKTQIGKDENVQVLGSYKDYYRVAFNDREGWILKDQ